MNLAERLRQVRGLEVWVLPTGYGKTTAILHAGLRDARVIHVLPLQAIVSQLARRLQEVGFDVCYQMAMPLSEVCKSPYFAARYNVTTLDSFVLNLFGIPVHEMYRDAWHSDVAWLMASHADFVIFDEYHLMTAPDGDGEVAKVHTAVLAAVRALRRRGLAKRILVLTATLTPSMIAELEPDRVVIYAPKNHTYVGEVKEGLGCERGGECPRVEPVEPEDDFAGRFRRRLVGVEFVEVRSRRACGGRVEAPDPVELAEAAARLSSRIDAGLSVFFAFNSWRRAALTYGERGGSGFLLHGKMDVEGRRAVAERLDPRLPLFATQVVEAGVDVSYRLLVTEPAPAFSLIQRTGRVVRHRQEGWSGAVAVLRTPYEAYAGVYDQALTEATLKLLEGEYRDLNWKVPVEGGRDYLGLLAALDRTVKLEASREVESLLDLLDEFAVKPRDVVERLDDLGGSLVRDSALFEAVVEGRRIPLDLAFLTAHMDPVPLRTSQGVRKVPARELRRRPLSTLWDLALSGRRLEGVQLPEDAVERLEVAGVEAYAVNPCWRPGG